MDQLIYHISIFQFPLYKADGEPEVEQRQAIVLSKLITCCLSNPRERSYPVRLSEPELQSKARGPKERGEQMSSQQASW